MRFILITKDETLVEAAKKGIHPSDELEVYEDWAYGLDSSEGADLIFIDMLATLIKPHEIDGYEKFGVAKMNHRIAANIPLVMIGPGETYKLDFMVGWPNFLIGHLQRPIDYRQFRRASTWV